MWEDIYWNRGRHVRWYCALIRCRLSHWDLDFFFVICVAPVDNINILIYWSEAPWNEWKIEDNFNINVLKCFLPSISRYRGYLTCFFVLFDLPLSGSSRWGWLPLHFSSSGQLVADFQWQHTPAQCQWTHRHMCWSGSSGTEEAL